LSQASHPSSWGVDGSGDLIPAGAGAVGASVQIPVAGSYGIWLGGSFRDRLQLLVDDRSVGTLRNQLNNSGQYSPLGQLELARGRHAVSLRYDGPDLEPGSGGAQFAMGPLVLS